MAYVFGAEPAIANFMVAFRLSHLFRRLFGEGAMQSAFTPHFEKLRHQDPQRSASFFRSLLYSLTIFLIGLILLCCIGIGVTLFIDSWTPATREILWLTFLMLPSLLFICLYGVNSALLQCQRIYFIPGVAPLAFNLVWIATVFMLQGNQSEYRISFLALGVVIACIIQWVVTLPQTLLFLQENLEGERRITLFSPDLRSLLYPLSLGILGVAATQVNNAVDAIFALYSGPGGPAFLWYAARLQQLPLAFFGISIYGALLPPLSRALEAKNFDLYKEFLTHALHRSFEFIFPITIGSVLLGLPLVNVIYGHGDFDQNAVIQTTYCVWAYLFGLIPAIFILILAPAYFAQKDFTKPALTSFLNMMINGILNFWFIFGLGWGPVSVAVATSISSWVNMIILLIPIYHNELLVISKKETIRLIKIIFNSLVAFFGAFGLCYLAREDLPIFKSLLPFGEVQLSRSLIAQIINFLVPTALFFLIYVLGAYCLFLNNFAFKSNVKKSDGTESIE